MPAFRGERVASLVRVLKAKAALCGNGIACKNYAPEIILHCNKSANTAVFLEVYREFWQEASIDRQGKLLIIA